MKIPTKKIVARAMRKPKFRKRLLKKPNKAISKKFGVEIPKGFEIRVVEESAKRIHLVIPAEPGSRGPEEGIVGRVLDKMRKDPEFKANVVADPKGMFAKVTGVEIPDAPEVQILEDTAKVFHIQLPPASPKDAYSPPDPTQFAEAAWGGGNGGGWGGDWVPEGSQIRTHHYSCCDSDMPTQGSAWDCCFDDDLPETEGPGGDGGGGDRF